MDSSHFESNFKRTINCPTTRANINEPIKRMTYWRYSGDSRMKKVGGTEGPRKNVGEPTNVSPAWWFSTVMKMDLLTSQTQHRLVNIARRVARKSSDRLKFCWLKVICCTCQSNELEREIKQKTRGASRRPAKNLRGTMAHPDLPLELPLRRYHCSVTYVTRQWRSYHEKFSFVVT